MSIRTLITHVLRQRGAMEGLPWFRAGYFAALNDIERTGRQPMTDKTKRESAERALRAWVDEPVATRNGGRR